MKKVFLALMCVAAIAMTSCSNDPSKSGKDVKDVDVTKLDDKTEKCWALGATVSLNGVDDSMNYTVWATEKEAVASAQELLAELEATAKEVGVTMDITVKYKEWTDASDETSCAKQAQAYDKEYEDASECWELSMSLGTLSETSYIWGHEIQLEMTKVMAEKQLAGVNVSYKTVDAKDEDACEALSK